jgi:hypothetical protein
MAAYTAWWISQPSRTGVGVMAEVGGRWGRRAIIQQVGVPGSSDHNTRLSMTGEKHAHPARIKVEFVCLRQARKRVPRDHDLELQPLEFVRRLDHHVAQAAVVQGRPKLVFLVVMGHPDGHLTSE